MNYKWMFDCFTNIIVDINILLSEAGIIIILYKSQNDCVLRRTKNAKQGIIYKDNRGQLNRNKLE